MSPSFDVAVIGLGPVGMAAAMLLAQRGVSVLALDRTAEVFDKPRAVGLDHESLRLFQNLGLAEAIAPTTGPYRPSEYRAPDGALLRRLLPQPEPNLLAWPANVMFIQPELDAMLRGRLGAWPGVTLRTGKAVTRIDQDAQGVTLALEGGGSVAARYAICCDGAGSPLRRQLGADHEDLDFDEPWVVVDTLLEDRSVPLPETNVQYCDPARPTTFIHGPRDLRRWEFMILPGEDPQAMATEESVWRLLAPWMQPGQARLWRIAAYRFHALVARPWRFGRAFLAGDAAHQTPPFMGQGLNQGLRDALNLCWKLALVVQGRAGEALLDSYEAERRPNVRAVIAITRDLGKIVCERDPVLVAQRDATLKAEAAAGRADVIRQDLLPPIQHGFIAAGTPGAGAPCPQPFVQRPQGRVRLDDAVGDDGFRLLLRADAPLPAEADALLARLGARALRLGVPPLVEADGLLAGWMARHGALALLERPDHVVFGTAADGPGILALLRAALAGLECHSGVKERAMQRRTLALAAVGVALARSAAAQETMIRGTAAYRERMALPPGSVLEVTLEDISRADAAARVLTTARIPVTGQVPIPFELGVEQSRIDPRDRYAVRATLSHEGRVLFRTDTIHPVLTRGAGDSVRLDLVRARETEPAAAAPAFTGTRWVAAEIRGVAAAPGVVSDITFATDRSAYGTGGCNRIRGGWTAEGAEGLSLGPLASTMMMCEGPKSEQERRFLDALGAAKRWRIENGALLLSDGAGAVLLRLTRG